MPRSIDNWVVLSAQLPAEPSSTRVALWRRLRAAGAAGLLNGTWLLPETKAHVALFTDFAETVRSQGGSATILLGQALDKATTETVMMRFAEDRDREYAEFTQRVGAFLAEIKRETKLTKFTFAELEEIEDDFDKLSRWLTKIAGRDFFHGRPLSAAQAELDRCKAALKIFAEAVYAREGLEPQA